MRGVSIKNLPQGGVRTLLTHFSHAPPRLACGSIVWKLKRERRLYVNRYAFSTMSPHDLVG